MSDAESLQAYHQTGSNEHFAAMVRQYTDMVYGYCLRQLRNADLAEEATHAVFIVLAQKARDLPPSTILSGWLLKTARYTVANALKIEARRRKHEQRAMEMDDRQRSADTGAAGAAALATLDEALDRLSDADRNALLLKFYERRSTKEISAALHVSEGAAVMRVSRALGKLQEHFIRDGVTLSIDAISTLLAASATAHAPTGMAAACARPGIGHSEAHTLAKGTIEQMRTNQLKTSVAAVTGVLICLTVIILGARATSSSRPNVSLKGLTPSSARPEAVAEAPENYAMRATDDTGSEGKLNQDLAAIVKNLGNASLNVREQAQQDLEVAVRKSGKPGFDLLQNRLLPELVRNGSGEASSRAASVVDRLTSPQLVWGVATGGVPFHAHPPAVSGGLVAQTTDSGLFLIDQLTGRLRTTVPGSCNYSLAAANGSEFYTTGPVRMFLPHACIIAYRGADGVPIWNADLSDLCKDGMIQAGPVYDTNDRLILVGTGGALGAQGSLVALNANGERVWNTDLGGSLFTPALSTESGMVYCCTWQNTLAAVRLADGTVAWRNKIDGAQGEPTESKGRVYVSVFPEETKEQQGADSNQSPREGYLNCYDATDCSLIWICNPSINLDSNDGLQGDIGTDRIVSPKIQTANITSAAAKTVNHSRVSFSQEGNLHVIGKPVITNSGGRVISQTPIILFGADTTNGKVLWQVPCLRFGYTTLAVANDVIYVGTQDSQLLAVRALDGHVLWKIDFNTFEPAQQALRVQAAKDGVRTSTIGTIGEVTIAGEALYATTQGGWTFALQLPQF